MNGPTPQAAAAGLRAMLQRLMSCVTAGVLAADSHGATTRLWLSTRLIRAAGGHLTLTIWHHYALTSDATASRSERWRTRTTGYAYRLDDLDGREIVAYHWHPDGRSPVLVPHVHLGAALGSLRPEASKAHLLTGRVTPVAVLWFAIERFRVAPRRSDWATVFVDAERDLSGG